jgi:hypothetical protein
MSLCVRNSFGEARRFTNQRKTPTKLAIIGYHAGGGRHMGVPLISERAVSTH